MSSTKTHEMHAQGRKLLKEIVEELPRTKLRDQDTYGNQEYERTAILERKVMLLLAHLELAHLGYTVWQISKPIPIRKTTGPEFLIPIRTSESPSLKPGGPQHPGSYTCYTVNTYLTAELDCIFVGELPKRE
ncbi:hypothetical protein N7G274_000664 [Stereocaulon virgatum]|uniref:Uncharacterized protein n=1 Tax=Stereocaulon virgatum TaxID=373712 RepID=A0ABR4APE7_9LECA